MCPGTMQEYLSTGTVSIMAMYHNSASCVNYVLPARGVGDQTVHAASVMCELFVSVLPQPPSYPYEKRCTYSCHKGTGTEARSCQHDCHLMDSELQCVQVAPPGAHHMVARAATLA